MMNTGKLKTYQDRAADFLSAISAMSLLQRKFIAAMAQGAQVFQIGTGLPGGITAFEAWVENERGQPEQVAKGLSMADFRSLKVLVPAIESFRNESVGYDFHYLPGIYRDAVKEALTKTMAPPEIVRMQAQYMARQLELSPIEPESETGSAVREPLRMVG